MGYIIVWRANHREPHVDMDMNYFSNEFDTFEQADEYAKETFEIENEEEKSPHFFGYAIFKRVEE